MAESDLNTPSDPPADPASMASDALNAAQSAVNQIDGAAASSAPDQATADALAAVQAALNEVNNPTPTAAPSTAPKAAAADPSPFSLPSFSDAPTQDKPANLDLLSDVNLNVKIELGRTRMFVEDVLKLAEGSVVELDKLAGDPVDIYVNERHVARGEVLVLNDNFCIRVNEIISQTAADEAA